MWISYSKMHTGHPNIISSSPEHTSEVVVVSIFFTWETGTDFSKCFLISNLNIS